MRVGRSVVLLCLAAVVAAGVFVVSVGAQPVEPADAGSIAGGTGAAAADPLVTRDRGSGASAAIGALFVDGQHYCTASVVHSPQGNLLLTAAHCIHDGQSGDYVTGITFAPGYHDGIAPFGYWTVSNQLVAQRWIDTSDEDLDVGFATAHQDGQTQTLESLTGANVLATGTGFEQRIRLTGYPDGAETPAVCENTTSRQSTYQLRVDCVGFPTGTSGGPWVTGVNPATGLGTVIGVIGGFQSGGDDPDTSYSSYFDTDVAALYRQETSRA